jgi:hypothetical protein
VKRLALLATLVAALAAVAPLGAQAAKNPCAEQGYRNYTRTDGTTFKSTGECTTYVVKGGTLVPIAGSKPTVVVDSASVSDGVLVFTFTASHFAASTQITELHYVSTAYRLDYLDPVAAFSMTDASGGFSLTVGTTTSASCVPGATVSVTMSDAGGNSATGSGTIGCA